MKKKQIIIIGLVLVFLLSINIFIKPEHHINQDYNQNILLNPHIAPFLVKGFNNIFADALLMRVMISPIAQHKHPFQKQSEKHEEDKHKNHNHGTKLGNFLNKMGFYIGSELSAKYLTDKEIYNIFEVIMNIDKDYDYAYKNLFYHFALLKENPEMCNDLFIKWIKIAPEQPMLYRYLTYNSIFNNYNQDETLAVLKEYLNITDKNTQKELIRDIISINQQKNTFYQKIYQIKVIKDSLKDAIAKENLDHIISDLTIKSTFKMLKESTSIYYKINNRYPDNLDDLIKSNLIDSFSIKFLNNFSQFVKWDNNKKEFVFNEGS